MKTIGAAVMFACMLVLSACGPSHSDQMARRMAERYYQMIQQGQLAEAAKFYPEKDRPMWLEILQQNQEKLGALKSYQVGDVEENTVYSGKFYIFTVDTVYEQDQESEVLTLKTWVSANDALTVVSQKLDAE